MNKFNKFITISALLTISTIFSVQARNCSPYQDSLSLLNENDLLNFVEIKEATLNGKNVVSLQMNEKVKIPNLDEQTIDEILENSSKIEQLLGDGARITDELGNNQYSIAMPVGIGPINFDITFDASIKRISDKSIEIKTSIFNQVFKEGNLVLSIIDNPAGTTSLKLKGETYMDKNV